MSAEELIEGGRGILGTTLECRVTLVTRLLYYAHTLKVPKDNSFLKDIFDYIERDFSDKEIRAIESYFMFYTKHRLSYKD
jgi:hypothetical protein